MHQQAARLLVATSADVSWTPMPIWPSFVPIVQELLTWCVAGQLQQRNLEVGQTLVVTAVTAAPEVPVSIHGPSGQCVSKIFPLIHWPPWRSRWWSRTETSLAIV